VALVAVVFDFDDTLAPDSTSTLLAAHGIDPERFWAIDARRLIEEGYDPPLAYLRLLVDLVGKEKPLGELTNASLRDFGQTLDGDFFDGIPAVFDDVRDICREHRDVQVEFFIISGGLEDVILGSEVVQQNFRGVYGCRLGEDPETGLIRYIKRCITFTEKIRYLFEINKGINPEESKTQPNLVNEDFPRELRPVPFDRVIYVGDGLTDIPCFSLVKEMGGYAFGVFDSEKKSSAKRAFQQFLQTERVLSMNTPHYGENGELGALLRSAVATVSSRIVLSREQAT
jgi:phosphoserine phosphatase